VEEGLYCPKYPPELSWGWRNIPVFQAQTPKPAGDTGSFVIRHTEILVMKGLNKIHKCRHVEETLKQTVPVALIEGKIWHAPLGAGWHIFPRAAHPLCLKRS
jgi:hypothetical protein